MPNLALAVAKYNADKDGIPKINFKGFLVGESFFPCQPAVQHLLL